MIFPNDVPSSATTTNTSEERMHPNDAPDGTLRELLIKQMTALSPVIKRCSSELIYELCRQDSEFIQYHMFKPVHLNCIAILSTEFQSPNIRCMIRMSLVGDNRCYVYVEEEFIRRTGYGNAIALLQMKGQLLESIAGLT